MGFDHRLSFDVVLKDTVRLEDVQQAFLPLVNYLDGGPNWELSFNEKLHSVSFESSGNVSHGFDDLVREVASNLSNLVTEADYFKLLDDSTGDPGEQERLFPVGTPEMIKAMKEHEAREGAVAALQKYTGLKDEDVVVVVDDAKKYADKRMLVAPALNPCNADRAALGMVVVEGFSAATGLDITTDGLQTAVGDLTANLMHLCAANGIDFEDVYRVASMHFEAEVAEESEQEEAAIREIGVIAHRKAIVEFVSAEPVDRECSGKVMGSNAFYTALSLGLNALVIPNKVLDRVPVEGESIEIDFKGGVGRVSSPEQGQGKGVDR